ncbi:hypothetical protein C8Q78DRAFT_1073099 [Trametes maxima]|nr:hypothetical protein C8Q78DRAFT_1073099 [Trametes maxima]
MNSAGGKKGEIAAICNSCRDLVNARQSKARAKRKRAESVKNPETEPGVPSESTTGGQVTRNEWRLAPTPLASAEKFLELKGAQYNVERLMIEAEPGTELVAFYVKDFVKAWGPHTQELAMDSTWNTNGGNFELFSAVADMNGFGLPLAFLFLSTTKDATSGAKRRVLERFLGKLKDLGVMPKFTLTDKDWSEIEAIIKQCLVKNKDTPAPYNAHEAHRLFSFIEVDFVPIAQMKPTASIPEPPERPIPRVRLLVDGRPPGGMPPLRIRLPVKAIQDALHPSAPSTSCAEVEDGLGILEASMSSMRPSSLRPTPQEEDGTIPDGAESTSTMHRETAPGHGLAAQEVPLAAQEAQHAVHALEPIPAAPDPVPTAPGPVPTAPKPIPTAPATQTSRRVPAVPGAAGALPARDPPAASASCPADADHDFDEEQWEGLDEDDIRWEVDNITLDDENVDPSAPTDPSETGGRSKRPNYQFCPAAHRLPLLRLYTKHACQHTLLPERHGQPRSAADIHRDAVSEMYNHCKRNNLNEVWAYMWNSWYKPDRWKLWARSAYAQSIPRKRTTMIVEALWRGIKHQVLPRYNRPPVDFALYSVVTKALPPYRLRLLEILRNPRASRAQSLSHVQKDLHRAWKRLKNVPIRGKYMTNVKRWTCDCGAQKYHSHLLCKHLVRAAGGIDASWWPKAERYHIPPFYTVPIKKTVAPPPETMRNQSWLPRIAAAASPIVQFPHVTPSPPPVLPDADADDPGSDVSIPGVETVSRSRSSSISSSPGKAPATGRDGLLRTRAGGGAGFELEDEEDVETGEVVRLLQYAATLFVEQDDPLFVPNAKRAARAAIRWIVKIAPTAGDWTADLQDDDVEDWPIPAIVQALSHAVKLVCEWRDLGNGHSAEEAKRCLRGVLSWARDGP